MRRHRTSTLMGMTKKELVEYVRMAENNQEVAEEALKQQAENVKDWIPVRHGKWVWKDFHGDGSVILCCSECLETEGARETSNYCHSCGAKMDKEE